MQGSRSWSVEVASVRAAGARWRHGPEMCEVRPSASRETSDTPVPRAGWVGVELGHLGAPRSPPSNRLGGDRSAGGLRGRSSSAGGGRAREPETVALPLRE
jgi:hypothetical protein